MENSSVEELYAVHRITQTLLRYCMAVDTRRPELMADCFTATAQLKFAFMGAFTPEEYIRLCKETLPRYDSTQHLIGPPQVEVTGDSAYSRCYFNAQHVINALAPRPCLAVGGWYEDQFVRVGAA